MPKVIEVIESEDYRGTGKPDNPYRRPLQYHFLDGRLLHDTDTEQYRGWHSIIVEAASQVTDNDLANNLKQIGFKLAEMYNK